MRDFIASIEQEYRRYKAMAERAITQVADADLARPLAPDGNSIAVIVWHIAGNLRSRFTDFLTMDGEKPWRDRDSEFVGRDVARQALLAKWEEGWGILFATLSGLDDDSLTRRVSIRAEAMAVHDALHRSLAHTASHVGQIVLIAKTFRDAGWETLSIPKAGRAK